MTISTTFLQNGSQSAEDLRLIHSDVIGSPGVVSGLAVTANGTRTLTVSGGSAFIPTTIAGEGGYYHVANISSSTYTVPTGVTGTRYLQARVLTTGGVTLIDSATQDASYITLGSFSATSTGGISTGNLSTAPIEYARMNYSLTPQSILCTSKTRPTQDLVDGLRIYEADTGLTRQYVKGAWDYVAGEVYASFNTAKVVSQTRAQAAKWKLGTCNAILRAGVVQGYINFTYNGSKPLVIPASGNMRNDVVCTVLNPYRPYISTRLASTHTGRLIYGSLNSQGNLYITSIASGADVSKGESFTLAWSCPVRPL